MENYLFSLDTKLQYLIILKNCLIIWLSNLFNLSVIQKRVMRTNLDIDVFINTESLFRNPGFHIIQTSTGKELGLFADTKT